MFEQVNYSQARFDEICTTLRPFLQQSGYQASKIAFVPAAGMAGVNLVDRDAEGSANLKQWWKGPTLVEALGTRSRPGPEKD